MTPDLITRHQTQTPASVVSQGVDSPAQATRHWRNKWDLKQDKVFWAPYLGRMSSIHSECSLIACSLDPLDKDYFKIE